MTEISFHFNVPDRMAYTVGLVRTALKRQMGVVVVGTAPALESLSKGLWQRAPSSFLAHCFGDASESMLRFSPVILASQAIGPWNERPLLINLQNDVPAGFERYGRLLELVTLDESDRLRARNRWKYYANQGYTITKTDTIAQKVPR